MTDVVLKLSTRRPSVGFVVLLAVITGGFLLLALDSSRWVGNLLFARCVDKLQYLLRMLFAALNSLELRVNLTCVQRHPSNSA